MNSTKKIIGLLFICLFLSNTAAKAQDTFIGEIKMFAGNFAPRGYAFCNGQLLAISSNTALFSLLGTMYGGDGRTTFGLPDMRGRVPMGVGSGPGLSIRTQGVKIGAEDHTLNITNLPSHNHTASITPATGTDNNILLSTDNAVREIPIAGDVKAVANYPAGLSSQRVKTFGPPSNTVISKTIPDTSSSTININANGGSQSFSIIQPSTTIQYIIALEGIYPSRS